MFKTAIYISIIIKSENNETLKGIISGHQHFANISFKKARQLVVSATLYAKIILTQENIQVAMHLRRNKS